MPSRSRPRAAGRYVIPLQKGWAPSAKQNPRLECALLPGEGWERIPRGGHCEPIFSNWGNNRLRFYAADDLTRLKCSPIRNGFYLHDSTKGYSHGCIEVENEFFVVLSSLTLSGKKRSLLLAVSYAAGRVTYGGTKS